MGNGAAWPTLFTGVSPARHGRYFRLQFDRASYEWIHFNDDDGFRHEPFWVQLSDSGRQVAVIDFGHAPLRRLNGIQIADWMTHDRELPPRSSPPELMEEITTRYGADPLNGNSDVFGVRPSADCERLCDLNIERSRAKTALSCDLLERQQWDLFMVSYHEPHDVGHQCWHLHEPTHPHHDAQWAHDHGDPVKRLYVELDARVGEILAAAGPDATAGIFFGPGMESNYNANNALDTMLVALEQAYNRTSAPIYTRLRSIYRRCIPSGIRDRFRLRTRLAAAKNTENGNASARPRFSHRRFFAMPHNQNAGAIRFNLVGRERYGVVPQGPQYDLLRHRLTEDLLAIKNADTGGPLIREIVDVSQHFRGEYRDELPDLLLLWSREAPIGAVRSPLIGNVKVDDESSRTGDHTQNALLLIAGPGVAAKRFSDDARVEDIAPTLAALLGESLDDVDGAPLAVSR